ncbi:AAA family ATPase [Gudongella sp. SC589]|uniref:AAA family ATPase n=1 Tax=Gudongella sp. SC589 TaxID=3385990 RepID=UPI0039046A0C
MNNEYSWIEFYEDFANKLLSYKNRQSELFEIIKGLSEEQPLMNYLHFEREDWWAPRDYRIDPFSVMGIFNRGLTDSNRKYLAGILADTFHIDHPTPSEFTGIPLLNNMNSFFGGTDELWTLFIEAIKAADSNSITDEFKSAFNDAIAVTGNGLAYITMSLFWIRPNSFMTLDNNSRDYITKEIGIKVPSFKCSGQDYVDFLSELNNKIKSLSPSLTFPEVSHIAWSKKKQSLNGEDKKPVEKKKESKMVISDKNLILYGPPGTGKTYNSVYYAVAIIEEKSISEVLLEDYENVFKRYLKYKEEGLIEFTTFHQSFSYEEFIEGIRPVLNSNEMAELEGEIMYEIHDGVFKKFCDNAGTPIESGKNSDLGFRKNPTVWKVSLEGTGNNPTRTECIENDHIRIGWDNYGESITDSTDFTQEGGINVLNAFYNRMQLGDIVFSCYSSRTIDAIGVVTGEPEWHDEYPKYKRLRKVKWLVKGISEDIVEDNAGKTMTLSAVYKLSVSVTNAIKILKRIRPELFTKSIKIPNRVFIIDEINRGNISKIFGELITLIEPTKRLGAIEQQTAKLPYSEQDFGVPDNVYLIGTMNSADRSIAMIDTALRRRFNFIEMIPDADILRDVIVESIDISQVLSTMNKRITVLLDRDHTIGHSYFLPLKTGPTIDTLSKIFKHNIIPLLQEYFFDDYEKIQLVVGDNQKQDPSTCFIIKKTDNQKLFGDTINDVPEYYVINEEAFMRIDSYAYF